MLVNGKQTLLVVHRTETVRWRTVYSLGKMFFSVFFNFIVYSYITYEEQKREVRGKKALQALIRGAETLQGGELWWNCGSRRYTEVLHFSNYLYTN